MAESRFAIRQSLVVEAANAIGTTYLRSQLLPEPYNSEVADLLRHYLDTRIAYHETGIDPVKVNEVIARTQTEQSEIWSKAVAAVNRRVLHFLFGPPSLPLGLRWAHAV